MLRKKNPLEIDLRAFPWPSLVRCAAPCPIPCWFPGATRVYYPGTEVLAEDEVHVVAPLYDPQFSLSHEISKSLTQRPLPNVQTNDLEAVTR